MTPLLPSYTLTLRKRAGLSQHDLAMLLGVSPSVISRLETGVRRPRLKLIAGLEIIFGERAQEIVPGYYRDVERDVLRRARHRRHACAKQSGPTVRVKLRFLDDLLARRRTSAS